MKGYRPNRIQQLTLIHELEKRGYTKPIIHHVIEETPLKVVVQIEYKTLHRVIDQWVVRFKRVML